MASTAFDTLSDEWQAAARYTAAGDVDILLSNPSNSYAFFAITSDDTAPVIEVRKSNPVGPMSSRPMTLSAGERLWVGGAGAFTTIEV